MRCKSVLQWDHVAPAVPLQWRWHCQVITRLQDLHKLEQVVVPSQELSVMIFSFLNPEIQIHHETFKLNLALNHQQFLSNRQIIHDLFATTADDLHSQR